MTRIAIITAILFVFFAFPVSAEFRMFGPNGWIADTESPEGKTFRRYREEVQAKQERERAQANEAAWREEQARIAEHNARMNAMYRAQNENKSIYSTCPTPSINKYNDGPDPGGHRRHVFRDKYGFGTPGGMYNAIRAERKALQRERKAAAKREANRKAQTVTMPKF